MAGWRRHGTVAGGPLKLPGTLVFLAGWPVLWRRRDPIAAPGPTAAASLAPARRAG